MFQRFLTEMTVSVAVLMMSSAAWAAPEHGEELAEEAVEHASSGGGLPQFDPTWFPSQIFWLAVMFGLLYFVFARKTLPTMSATIDNRRNQIESDMSEAEALTEQAQKVQAEYEANLAAARNDATKASAEVERAIKDKAADAQNAFRERAEKDMASTEKAIEKARNETMSEIETIVASLTAEATKKLAGLELSKSEVQKVIAGLVAEDQSKKAA
ncbi:MAG: hypothetical protein AB7E85_08760 [Pseudobdellovibrionaceae bacterium]